MDMLEVIRKQVEAMTEETELVFLMEIIRKRIVQLIEEQPDTLDILHSDAR